MSKKPVILTGLRANNELHIGNYFGALLPIVDMAKTKSKDYQINLFIPDLHSITTPIDYKKLQSQIISNLKVFVAAGLPLNDPNVHIYRQSYIPAHSELTWILMCFSSFGQLRRMTQFKDKAGTKDLLLEAENATWAYGESLKKVNEAKDWESLSKIQTEIQEKFSHAVNIIAEIDEREGRVSTGLFNYPVLMSADILLYGAEYVPVGDDQSQHLEFTRDIAQRINSRFGEILIVPRPVSEQHKFFAKDQGLRIKDLADPTKKMSKSAESDKGVIFLQDSSVEATKKIMSAATDSINQVKYGSVNQPGVSNLIEIYGLIKGKSAREAEAEFANETQYGRFKQKVAEAMEEFLENFQAKLAKVDQSEILTKLEYSEAAMNQQANETLLKVQKAVGLR